MNQYEDIKRFLLFFFLGLLVLIGVLAMAYWGAYTSCSDGGGYLRGGYGYYQCVNFSDSCDVPFMDGISLQGCNNLCSKKLFPDHNTTIQSIIDSANQNFKPLNVTFK